MTEKNIIGIDKNLQKTIKKLAAWLDISQSEVIKKAITEYEKNFIFNKGEVEKILQAATDKIWAVDPKSKEIQLKLLQGSETIDDFIANNWDSGLDL